MGEARRRKLAGHKHGMILYRDGFTNELKYARNAGDPVAFLHNLQRNSAVWRSGSAADSKVPCNGCVACCYYDKVDIDPSKEKPDDLRHLDTTANDDGSLRLRKRADGACIHLGDTGCTVYEHRPRVCRAYDCRLGSLVGVREPYENDHVAPVWIFDPKDFYGKVLKATFFMLGVMHQASARKSGGCATVEATVRYAMENLHKAFPAFEAIMRMTPEERCAALGIEKLPSPEEQQKHFATAFAALSPDADKHNHEGKTQ